jgi:signal transduction histidine kinase
MIFSSGQILVQSVNDILDFVKAESTEIHIAKQSVELADCIDQAIDVVLPALVKKNLPIYLDVNPGTVTQIVTDGARLVQILINLLSNAIKVI